MVEVKIKESKPPYSRYKTFKKALKRFAIWIIPQIAAYLLVANPDFASMSVGALISMGSEALVDYLKHRD